MIIRATNKLLKISGIKHVRNDDDCGTLSGDWYANILKTGRTGKLFILFFHNKAKISIICPTKSLNIAAKQLPQRVQGFLIRYGFVSLINPFDLTSEVKIFTTNSKSTLAFMTQVSLGIESYLNELDTLENIDLESLEDIQTSYLFSINGNAGCYETTIDILNRFVM